MKRQVSQCRSWSLLQPGTLLSLGKMTTINMTRTLESGSSQMLKINHRKIFSVELAHSRSSARILQIWMIFFLCISVMDIYILEALLCCSNVVGLCFTGKQQTLLFSLIPMMKLSQQLLTWFLSQCCECSSHLPSAEAVAIKVMCKHRE